MKQDALRLRLLLAAVITFAVALAGVGLYSAWTSASDNPDVATTDDWCEPACTLDIDR